MNLETTIVKSAIILVLLMIVVCEAIITVSRLKLRNMEIKLIDAEIMELKRLQSIDKYLLDVIPDDDNWEPDNIFVKNVVTELNARGIKATEAEVWKEMTEPDDD